MKVLFLSSSMGGGHAKTAEAIIESLKEKDPGAEAVIVDTLKYISPVVDRLITGLYLTAVKNTPMVYGMLYDMSERGDRLNRLTKTFNRVLSSRLLDLIEDFDPSVIVCTHSFPLQMLSSLKAKGRLYKPVIGIVTDYVNHPFWKLDGIDAFIVAHEQIKRDMIRMGIPQETIHTSGIPVSGRFLAVRDRTRLLLDLGFEDKMTVLIMGGSLGYGEVSRVFSSLLGSRRDMQIIAVSGKNARLRGQLEKLSSGSEKRVSILGYTDRIPDLMDAADIVITKPGGVTISEALVKKLPILVVSPIPGQEVRNTRFLTNTGAAVPLARNCDMERIFRQIVDDPSRIKQMKEIAGTLAKPHAGEYAANLIEYMALNSRTHALNPGISS